MRSSPALPRAAADMIVPSSAADGRAAAPLLALLRRPEAALDLTPAAWTGVLLHARQEKLSGSLAAVLAAAEVRSRLPARVVERLVAEERFVANLQRTMLWELRLLQRTLRGSDSPIVLLKGASYLLADLPPARGRMIGDIDLLVAKAALADTERLLVDAGWQSAKLEPYDQRYYREFMHELPPLVHPYYRASLDVHHNIAPPTGRVKIDAAALMADREAIGDTGYYRLSPPDMLLHTAIHLFQDGTVTGGLRDLYDFDRLCRAFGREAGFWPRFVERVRALGAGRPVYFALRYARIYHDTPIPSEALDAIGTCGPARPVRPLMDRLVEAAFRPPSPRPEERRRGAFARWLLYLRSHWLRMPPLQLARHLGQKALMRARPPRGPR